LFSQSNVGTVARSYTVIHCLFFTWLPVTPNWTCAFDCDV